jgi:biopolymer transport protein ExbD
MRFKPEPEFVVPVDIAPLIDTVFLLLLFFMLTYSTAVQSSIHVTLPKAKTSQTQTGNGVTITLTKDHLIYWQDEAVSESELERRLREVGDDQVILIRADRHAYVDRLMALWDLCRTIGISKVHIATLQQP